MLGDAVAAKAELQQDPDYESWLKKFDARTARSRDAASKTIGSRSARQMFDVDISADLLNSRADLAKDVFGRRAGTEIAKVDDSLLAAQDIARDALDEPTRFAAIKSVNDAVQGLVEKGYLSPEDGRAKSQKWVTGSVKQTFQARKDRGDLTGARQFFDQNRPFLRADEEMLIENQLQDAEEARTVITTAASIMAEAPPVVAMAPGKRAVAQGTDAMVAITAKTESGNRDFRADGSYVTSPKGARGRMQVMPGTQRDPGFGVKPAANDSAEELARVGRDYLQAMMRRYGGDPAKAWAAYNGGPGRVDDAISQGGDWLSRMPGETRAYVAKNMKALGGNVPSGGEAGQQYDLGSRLARVDALAVAEKWTPERREKVKNEVERLVSRAERVVKDTQDDAYDLALAKAVNMGEGFTDPSQLGDAFYRASPTQRNTLQGMAESNHKAAATGTDPKANSPAAFYLDKLELDAPKDFASADLSQYFPMLTVAERSSYMQRQIKVRDSLQGWTPYTGINAAVTHAVNFGGMKLSEERQVAIRQIMQGEAERFHKRNGGKDLTDKDFDGLFISAIRDVPTTGYFGGKGKMKRYDLTPGSISTNDRNQIETALKKAGMPHGEDDIMSFYRRHMSPARAD